jgi:hypothetical protein
MYKYFITCNVMTKLVNSMNKSQEFFLDDYVVQLGRGQVLAHKIKEGYVGFSLGSWESSGRKISKKWALWEKVNL